jgi:hypothetical protein
VQAISKTKGHPIIPLVVRRIRIACLSWVLLALGSFIFHASQTAWGELVDELGMMSVSCSMCYALRGRHPVTAGISGLVFYFIFFGVVFASMMIYIMCGYHPFFASVFIITSLVSVILLKTMPHSNVEFTQRIHKGVVHAITGYCIWHIDQVCVSRKWSVGHTAYEWELQYWSHPIWHLLTASAGQSFLGALTLCHLYSFKDRETDEKFPLKRE